jgi:benzoate/toluate 1,2-dioxygenase subunit alpha
MITRDKTGTLHALINACSHRGAMLCRHKRQNKATFTCPFHGWTFNNTGKLLKGERPRRRGLPRAIQQKRQPRPEARGAV